ESPVRCAAATKSSVPAHAACAPNAAPAKVVAEHEAPNPSFRTHAFGIRAARVFKTQLPHLIGHAGTPGYSASPLFRQLNWINKLDQQHQTHLQQQQE